MRNLEISETRSRLTYGRVTWIVRIVKNWQMRKLLKHLQDFPDYQLSDIGLTRSDLNRLWCLPPDIDMVWCEERPEMPLAKEQFSKMGNIGTT